MQISLIQVLCYYNVESLTYGVVHLGCRPLGLEVLNGLNSNCSVAENYRYYYCGFKLEVTSADCLEGQTGVARRLTSVKRLPTFWILSPNGCHLCRGVLVRQLPLHNTFPHHPVMTNVDPLNWFMGPAQCGQSHRSSVATTSPVSKGLLSSAQNIAKRAMS